VTSPDPSYPAAFGSGKNTAHWKPATVTWSEIIGWMQDPKDSKDVGGYVFADLVSRRKIHASTGKECSGGYHRDNKSIETRSALIVLDVDAADPGFEVVVEMLLAGHAYVLHTTYSSTPDDPRYRLIVQADREMTVVEYGQAAESLAQRLPGATVDRRSFAAAQFMYFPAEQRPGWFEYWVGAGEPLEVDDLLATLEFVDAEDVPAPGRNKRNPFEIDGPVGAFNRVYADWDLLFETFDLPYESVTEGRWRLKGSSHDGGLTLFSDGLVQSFHANDPAFGTQNAFDLVRLHRYLELDEAAKPGTPVNRLPSHLAMVDEAMADEGVVRELFNDAAAAFADSPDAGDSDDPDDDSWKLNLNWNRQGKLSGAELHNWDILRRHDPIFRRLRYNDMTSTVEWLPGELPWREVLEEVEVTDEDRTEFHDYLIRTYRFDSIPRELFDRRVDAKARANSYYPVRDYLDGLMWDGVPRLEECLPGVTPTDYTRWVARKCLVAAVARVYEPGCFWDHTLVLYGDEGVGKSKWISRMSSGWSANLPSKIDGADAMMVMQRSWIVVSDEGHAMKRSDFEALKDFLTRTEDTFRRPYARQPLTFKRRAVVWSTTNDETFLRNEVGNRRFLVVRCEGSVDFDVMDQHYVDQVWAEAVDIYRSGAEDLFVSREQGEQAALERSHFTEEDVLAGVVVEYLGRLVPDNWDWMDRHERVRWMADREFNPPGTEPITRVCSAELFEIAFGRRLGDDKPGEIPRLTNIMKRLDDWAAEGVSINSGGYGPQLMFVRKDSLL
jgi:predicted P-loop ATPase